MDFDLTPYQQIREALLLDEIQCGINGRHQISVSTQVGAVWPNRGNSFWITHAPGKWFLFTWSPQGYALPDDARITDLCRRCMEIEGNAMYVVPEEIIKEFDLRELTRRETKAILAKMKTAT